MLNIFKCPGQLAYEADVARRPTYHDGTPRKTWSQLCQAVQDSWKRGLEGWSK